MKRLLSFFVLTFFVKFGFGQVYQSMPQYGYGPVKRFDIDSSLTIPTTCGVPSLRTNLTKKSAIAFDTCNNRFYFYNAKTSVWDTIKSGATIDTANKWVNSVTAVDDSTIQIVKGTTTSNITIKYVTSARRLITPVYNNTGVTISKGSVIYISGKHSSNLPTIALAKANNETNSYKTFALVLSDIPTSNSGYVVQAGNIGDLNLPTNTYTDGDILYLSPTVAGGFTTTKPIAPNHIVKLGSVTRAHPTQGSIELKIENGWQLDEMSDVSIASTPLDSTLLQFSRVDSLWHDVSPTTAIGTRYIKPSDTASMLTNYAKTSAVNLKVNISDTASMLTNYAKTSVVNLKLNTSDSSTYFTKYRSDTMRTNLYTNLLRKTDTSTLSTRIDLRVKYSDTASMLTNYAKTSLVNTKVNISDTTSMLTNYAKISAVNLKVNISDTASMLTNYAKTSTVNLKLNISDSANMLLPYLRKIDTATLSSRINLKQDALTFSTGLTNSSNTVTSNLSTGVNGGQSIIGGTAASNNLTLSSTSNATKGKLLFGNSAYDEANNRLGINTSSPAVSLDLSGNNTTNNSAQFGTFGVQSYGVNNAWIGDNAYYNGTAFVRRSAGYTGLFYFQGNEGQFRWGTSSTAGSSVTNGSSGFGLISLKTNLDKTFAVGDMPSASGSYTGANFIVFGSTGNAAINRTTDAGFKLDVNGSVRLSSLYYSALSTAPTSATATGTTGEIRIDANYIYICTATNTWKRVAIATW